MLTFVWEKYYEKAKDRLETAANLKNDALPSIAEIWREAIRIAWPEPEVKIQSPRSHVVQQDGPFWIIVDGVRYLVWVVDGILTFKECKTEDLLFEQDDPECGDFVKLMTEKFGQPVPCKPVESEYKGPGGF
jgi:hypothetical protein|tara:strand:- start:5872 stop:6267 length:396 start_codon:yes stop_codon:yes gene_type:complete